MGRIVRGLMANDTVKLIAITGKDNARPPVSFTACQGCAQRRWAVPFS